MPQYDWHELLSAWSRELIEVADEDDGLRAELTPEVAASGWLGFAGATDEQIATVEDRLGAALPPSYREFLKVTNGWRFPKFSISRIWSTEEIDWLAVLDSYTIEVWNEDDVPPYSSGPPPRTPDDEYFAYDDDGRADDMRPEYLRSALLISEREWNGTGIYLLIPEVVTTKGEWEAWFMAHWIPGAVRFRSFWDMMRHEYKNDIRLKRNQ